MVGGGVPVVSCHTKPTTCAGLLTSHAGRGVFVFMYILRKTTQGQQPLTQLQCTARESILFSLSFRLVVGVLVRSTCKNVIKKFICGKCVDRWLLYGARVSDVFLEPRCIHGSITVLLLFRTRLAVV